LVALTLREHDLGNSGLPNWLIEMEAKNDNLFEKKKYP